MSFDEKITYPDIQNIIDDTSSSDEKKVEKLIELYRDERDAQRAATESNMVDDDGHNARLRHIKLALESLNVDVQSVEDTMAATL